MKYRYGVYKMSLIVCSLFVLSLVFILLDYPAYANLDLPISQWKPVTASTQEGWNPVENAVDGFESTRWAASSGAYPNWVKVDLGSISKISHVDIKWFDPENRSYKYTIEVSDDDENFTEVVDQTQRTEIGNSSDQLEVMARYVRVTVTGGTGSPSLYEFQVFGTEGKQVSTRTDDSQENQDKEYWVGTWATSPQLVEPHNMPPSPGLSDNTLRQVIRVSIAGKKIRLKLSNQYGNAPLTINAIHIAESAGGNKIKPETDQILTFGGKESVTIPPGQTVTSDTLDFALARLSNIAITTFFGNVPSDLTGHPGSRTTSYIVRGNVVDDDSMPSAINTDHWYVIAGLDILTDEKDTVAIVALGDSITDGRGSITNMNNRWTDNLANRLQENADTTNVAVLNHGIGGNSVLAGGLGPTTYARFERDVLEQSGVRYLIILAGVNDIGGGNASMTTARDLITAYQAFIFKAREKGILVYGGTILPFGGSGYYSPLREEIRQTVNKWIRTSGQFDAVIDFDLALQDPNEPTRLLQIYDDGDHLHPSVEGYKRMGEIIDLSLFVE